MGKRGPKKTPTNILRLRGSRRADDRPKNEPQPRRGMPEPPDYLQGEALAEWHRKAELLYEQGTLTLVDDTILAAYCLAYELMLVALEECRKEGQDKLKIITKTVNCNTIQFPALGVYRTALKDMIKFAAELGMTPSGRTGINVPDKVERRTSAQKWLAKQKKA